MPVQYTAGNQREVSKPIRHLLPVLSANVLSFRRFAILLLVGKLALTAGCKENKSSLQTVVLKGATMGTTYTVRYVPRSSIPSPPEIQQKVDEELSRVNLQMSTYLDHSEIASFNESPSTDWFPVSSETVEVVELAQKISDISGGAFDVTVGPLVNLWGFGPGKRRETPPSDEEIQRMRKRVGYEKLTSRREPPSLKKSIPELRIDLSAIAKGDGVDRVGRLLETGGITDYFVEIGGEIVARGRRSDGKPWQVGIEAPRYDERAIQLVIGISDAAIATSGDYRNYFESDGRRFSHTIDPHTGYPTTKALASASVVAENCALADAIATAMMAMGADDGIKVANRQEWAVLLMLRREGRFVSLASKNFAERFPEAVAQLENQE